MYLEITCKTCELLRVLVLASKGKTKYFTDQPDKDMESFAWEAMSINFCGLLADCVSRDSFHLKIAKLCKHNRRKHPLDAIIWQLIS